MYYVVGLGNPGKEYAHTRHNVGADTLLHFANVHTFSSWYEKSTYTAKLAEGVCESTEVLLILPQTFMNDSGNAVKKILKKGDESELIVVYDDIDLPFGDVKISFGRGHGGHNGVRSIIDSLGTQDFIRVRVGIAQKSLFTGSLKRPQGEAMSQFVLGAFSRSESKVVPLVLQKVCEAIDLCIREGRDKAMNKYN